MSECACKCLDVTVTLQSNKPVSVDAIMPHTDMTVCGYLPGERGEKGEKGDTGDVWLPDVTTSGDISWTKDSTDVPPTSVNIMGPQGPQGDKGEKGDTPEMEVLSNIEIENLIRSFV